jgi:hypothetical protein
VDLKNDLPKQTKYSWYKFNSHCTLQCNACGAKIERRFADFDIGLATLLTSGGIVSIWGAGKIVLPTLKVPGLALTHPSIYTSPLAFSECMRCNIH